MSNVLLKKKRGESSYETKIRLSFERTKEELKLIEYGKEYWSDDLVKVMNFKDRDTLTNWLKRAERHGLAWVNRKRVGKQYYFTLTKPELI